MKRMLLGIVGVALSLVTAVQAVDAAARRAEKCAAAELRAAGKKAAAKLRCHEKALTRGRLISSGCLAVPTLASRWRSPRSRRGAAPRPTTWPKSRTGWTDSSRACSTRCQAATETEPVSNEREPHVAARASRVSS